MRIRSVLFASLVIAPALVVVAMPFDAASADKPDAGPSDAGARDAAAARIPPDPPPMNERWQWVFDLRWDKGDVYLVAVHKIDTGGPHPTPRVMGRFALELYEGPTLIERVRFDFPMLGAPVDDRDAGFHAPPRFEPKLRTRIGVLFPATNRGTRLELWDRATDARFPLAWPPREGLAAPPDAGPQRGEIEKNPAP